MKFKPTLKRIKFGGLAAIELRTAKLRLVALTAKGPRLAFWGRPGGDNLLLWAPGKYRRGPWDLMGGHRLWVSRPGADEAEETYAADNRPCTVEVFANGFTVTRVITYDAVIQKPSGLESALVHADGVLLYSPRTARIWCDLVAGLEKPAATPKYYCLSENVAKTLPQHWKKRVAKTPDESAMLALLD